MEKLMNIASIIAMLCLTIVLLIFIIGIFSIIISSLAEKIRDKRDNKKITLHRLKDEYGGEKDKDKMSIDEAINIIDLAIEEVEWNYPMEYVVAFEVAKDAMLFKKNIMKE